MKALRIGGLMRALGQAIAVDSYRRLRLHQPRLERSVDRCPLIGIEPLERRTMLAAITWTGAVDDLWSNAGNWSGNQVPIAGDDVTIPDASAHTPVRFTSGSATIGTLAASDPLKIEGGTFKISGSGPSAISDAFDLTGGTLLLSGSGVTLTSTGAMSVTGATIKAEAGAVGSLNATSLSSVNLSAVGGGQLSFPAVKSYSGSSGADTTISADGAGAR
ncbi:MAG: hypothetical protein IT435_13220, partial [Phycisphaerales bacterium]|nr:hypothetical protein [Phycisphaerales bacterium]